MSDKIFVDSNVLLYLLGDDLRKNLIARRILYASPVISTQVIAENLNIIFRKLFLTDSAKINGHKEWLEGFCEVVVVTAEILSQALRLKERYLYQWYDCVILATALANNCETLYSEDMQHGQVIEGSMTIINPFVTE